MTNVKRSIIDRMRGAAMLDIATYEEVEADTTATGQAAIVVVISAIASAIGAAGPGGPSVIGVLVGSLISWVIWAGITYVIGDKLFAGTATWGELLRTLGFAQAPRVL
ncbi:MAG: YIP1 family protein, partial [Gemmatimonadota bacterium]|nr:YIP1 family protein [Gemmatimonadota bacterium]